MLNWVNQIFIVCLLFSGIGLLLVVLANNRNVNQLEKQIRQYELQITREEEKIRNLHAEIAHLSHPERIAALAAEHLPHLRALSSDALFVPEENLDGIIIWRYRGKKMQAADIRLSHRIGAPVNPP